MYFYQINRDNIIIYNNNNIINRWEHKQMSILHLVEFCLFISKEGEVKITEEARPYTEENQASFLRINCFASVNTI